MLGDKPLEGCVIRCSNNDGEYIIGCRMPEDSEAIKDYVSKITANKMQYKQDNPLFTDIGL